MPNEDLQKLYDKGAEKAEDWEDVSDLSPEERADLQRPMNRHERRAAIKLARLQRKATTVGQDFLIQFFKYDHLPEHLQAISKPFGELANRIVDTLPRNPERTVALRKLLEAKDCAVRANLAGDIA